MNSKNRQKRPTARGTKWPPKEPLPKFDSLREQEDFYATHDFSDLFDSSEPVESNPPATRPLRGRKPQTETRRGTREMRLLVPQALADEVRNAASGSGRSVSNWLLEAVKKKLATAGWSIRPGETAPLLDHQGRRAAAFIHLTVTNPGDFCHRVRGWIRFSDEEGQSLGAEMPIRWSSRPEPLMPMPLATPSSAIEYRWVPNPALLVDGYATDFAAGEEQAFAFAIKMDDGTCWGWTQESYLHAWRHPAWKLPAGRVRVAVRLMANGEEVTARCELDTTESIESIVVRGDKGSTGVQGQAATTLLRSDNLPPNVIPFPKRES
jgi:hypothetical protein